MSSVIMDKIIDMRIAIINAMPNDSSELIIIVYTMVLMIAVMPRVAHPALKFCLNLLSILLLVVDRFQ